MQTVLLLTISNLFMTIAWYGHLKHRESPIWIAILVSWLIAFAEYCFQVPANRWGAERFSPIQLKVMQEVITLAPGSIIKFDKGCEQLLRLLVGENAVAVGEAVKVGEKFGFRVTSMLMPPEHFVTAKRARSA